MDGRYATGREGGGEKRVQREIEAALTGEIWGGDRRLAREEGNNDPEHGWTRWDEG